MKDLRNVIIWFLVCLVLVIYAKTQGFLPDHSVVLGEHTAVFPH